MKNLIRITLACLSLGWVGCGSIDELPPSECATASAVGCACDATSACGSLADGTRLSCATGGTCQLPNCAAAEGPQPGCVCGTAGHCAQGLVCANGRCENDTGQTLTAPTDARCYTPCRGGAEGGGAGSGDCSVDGLMEGCIDGALCRAGSCVLPVGSSGKLAPDTDGGQPEASCTSDTQCPDFQTCIQNRCYSDCQGDADCREGRSCYRKVCRIPCSATGAACPSGMACATVDGQTGYCAEVAAADALVRGVPSGSFELSTSSLSFGSQQISGSFTLVNRSGSFQEFTIRKASHTEFSDRGPKVITETPLAWLKLGESEAAAAQVQELTIGVDGNGQKEIWITATNNDSLSRWSGELEVQNLHMGTQTVRLGYSSSLEGRWSGQMFFLANFGDLGLEDWRADRGNAVKLRAVGNAFIRRWGALRGNRISLDEFKAVLTATHTESWKWPSVQKRCPDEANPNPNVGCYLYTGGAGGVGIYSDYLPDNPIPTGTTEFPFAMDIRRTPLGAVGDWSGRIVSETALQYAGSPAVSLKFASDPNDCGAAGANSCIIGLESFYSKILIGGRYLTQETDTACSQVAPGTFGMTRTPWLVPSFGPNFDATSNRALGEGPKARFECRDKLLPFNSPDLASTNLSLAASNPVPDGSTRHRTLELVDGALIDQDTLFVIFKEHFPSFLDPADTEGFSAYGYMLLRRRPADLKESDFKGSPPVDYRVPSSRLLNVGCSDTLLAKTNTAQLDASTAARVGGAVLEGVVPSASPPPVLDPAATSGERVHYLCSATGYFDGGPRDDGTSNGTRVECPAGSQVRYFTLQGATAAQAAVATLSCQQGNGICRAGEPCAEVCAVGTACPSKGTCGEQLAQWAADPSRPHSLRQDPVFRCTDPNEVLCNTDRHDLRAEKHFYAEGSAQVVFQPLEAQIHQAFRYKTQFRNRTGTGIGFVPQTCTPGSDEVPYCYDPQEIEEIRDRVDCATHVYTRYYAALGTTPSGQEVRSRLKSFLVRDYSYLEQFVPGVPNPIIHDGFERLYAELLIMLGDESYTSSFASRFDLAGQKLADFEGSAFEPNGINLSGGAGFEMRSLYQAAQYYQMTLERFYRLSPVIWISIGELPAGQGFITPQTASSYFDKLIRASSQKARSWSQVAKKYQSFNRPELARLVVSRAYTSAYLESVILSRMMLKIIYVSNPDDKAQIVKQLELAQQTYRAAMMEMSTVYRDIRDTVTYFGFQPDYIPFPALDPGDTNAFDKALARAQNALEVAEKKETTALADNRSFDTDAASFQSALAGLRDQNESALAEICGTFLVTEQGEPQVYPAIPRYAQLHPRAAALGDPCGRMGNGALYDAAIGLEQAGLELDKVKLSRRNLIAEIADVAARTSEQCARITTAKDFYIQTQDKVIAMNDAINSLNLVVDTADRLTEYVANVTSFLNCDVGVAVSCPMAAAGATLYTTAFLIDFPLAVGAGITTTVLQHEIASLEKSIVVNDMLQECTAAQIDSKYEIKTLYRQMLETQLEALKVEDDITLAVSQIQKLRHQSLSLMSSLEEDQANMVNIEAARNDPNVRIYRNDAIVAADQTFFRALQEAYKATKVFEYYTSQSYAPLGNLVLVRMVAHGDFTLESYLTNLEQAFEEFQEQFGNPDTRVAILSVKDDVLAIPRLDAQGVALSEKKRTAMFRERLGEVTLLDGQGYVNMPFSTTIEGLSPLTLNHKIRFMEAEIVGRDVGDTLGRIYVRQRGTGAVRGVSGETGYYAFPTRTAVMNPFFNGTKDLDASIYGSERLRDRPFINTGWELVLNRKDEAVNRDIQITGLDDIKLYLYYTDFTAL
ncbi:MAG: hypothetical protein M3Y59_00925 [Myxococcota bacterium]|nr:hypothetical protein [Myxococcota bacterium]